MSKIDVTPNIDAYFEEIVHDAVVARAVEASPAAEHYVAAILSDYARGATPKTAFDRPLTFELRDALESPTPERFDRLRHIGDGVLYLLGFFRDGVTRRGADPDYVKNVGASAYGHASAMMRMGGSDGHDVLDELARKFDAFVAVIGEVSDGLTACAGTAGRDTAILRLYERWEQSGSTRLATMLGSFGLAPMRNAGNLN